MEKTYLSFSVVNVITVCIMAALGYAVLSGATKLFSNLRGGGSPFNGAL